MRRVGRTPWPNRAAANDATDINDDILDLLEGILKRPIGVRRGDKEDLSRHAVADGADQPWAVLVHQ